MSKPHRLFVLLSYTAGLLIVGCDDNAGNLSGSEPRKESEKPATLHNTPAQGPPDGRSGGSTAPSAGGIGNPTQLPRGESRDGNN